MGIVILTGNVVIDHSHSQRPVPRDFPLFKRCKWLVGNCNVAKWVPPHNNRCLEFFPWINQADILILN